MLRRVRLITGLILFFYVSTHILPLVLGNHSLDLSEWTRPRLHAVWEAWIGQAILYGAMLIHLSLGIYAIYRRRRWRGIRPGEAAQLATGLAVPILLALHLVSTRAAATLYELDPTYPWILAIYLKYDTVAGWRQAGVLAVAWLHGCIGIYYWLRLKPIWPTLQIPLFSIALLWPALAFTGFWKAGTEAAARTADPAYVQMVLAEVGSPDAAETAFLYQIESWIIWGVVVAVAASLVARKIRGLLETRRGVVNLRYDDGTEVRFNQGLTLLEASRECRYPHASVCGGRGRCSTCRVRIRCGADLLPEASEAERKVLARVKAGPDVRLACQCVPSPGRLEVTPLLPPTATAGHGHPKTGVEQGREQAIAVMFCDLRGFTQVSEDRLPYDTVFLLNRYFDAMGKAIEESGGHLDKFIGDGIMALFGIAEGPEAGTRQALRAAKRMSERLAALNEGLANDLDAPLRIGIGIHVGRVIVGEMGYGRATQLTAIGNAVNVASRLEALTKEHGVQLVASRSVFRMAEVDFKAQGLESVPATVRGRTKPIHILAVDDPSRLSL
jgi:adenylate cyclase